MAKFRELVKELSEECEWYMKTSKKVYKEALALDPKDPDRVRLEHRANELKETGKQYFELLCAIRNHRSDSIREGVLQALGIGVKMGSMALNQWQFATLEKIELNNGLNERKGMQELNKATLKSFM